MQVRFCGIPANKSIGISGLDADCIIAISGLFVHIVHVLLLQIRFFMPCMANNRFDIQREKEIIASLFMRTLSSDFT